MADESTQKSNTTTPNNDDANVKNVAAEADKKNKKDQKKEQKRKQKEEEKEQKKKAVEDDKRLQDLVARAIKQKPQDDSHKFWDTQPVPKLSDSLSEFGPFEVKKVEEIQKEPYPLPKGYEWYEADVNSNEDMDKIYDLLYQNYVEDDDSMFRFAYPIKFLRWALTPPEWRRIWHLVVRVSESGKFVAFISGIPMTMRVKDAPVKMVEINFLCVHKQLREKRLAPLLIKEITRRVNLTDIWQAVYTAGIKIPKPVSTARYFHRSLNPQKLIAINFSRIPPKFQNFKDPMSMTEKLYKLPEKPQTPGFRALTAKDIPQVYTHLVAYLKKFTMAPEFTEKELKHWLMPLDNVVYSYVVEDPKTKQITDFGSFYNLPSSIIGHAKYKILNAAYLFYYFANKTPLKQLITDLLIAAKMNSFDVFNCLDIMDNSTFVNDLKFGPGDGHLYYYLYNYKCPELPPAGVGLTML
jgi:glycylpeptide N-tetradecanoyltransferase